MVHDINQIRSLRDFIQKNKDKTMTYDEIFNAWIQDSSLSIQDPDTVDYYMALMPMIERRLDR